MQRCAILATIARVRFSDAKMKKYAGQRDRDKVIVILMYTTVTASQRAEPGGTAENDRKWHE